MYSNGLSEIILGKAIKQHNLPRDEIVVLTKVYFTCRSDNGPFFTNEGDADGLGFVNQHGLSRKVRFSQRLPSG